MSKYYVYQEIYKSYQGQNKNKKWSKKSRRKKVERKKQKKKNSMISWNWGKDGWKCSPCQGMGFNLYHNIPIKVIYNSDSLIWAVIMTKSIKITFK
jgi:hypothetical protein